MGTLKIGKSDSKKATAIPTQIVEKIVEVIKEVEVKVPEYITIIKEEKVEVPVFYETIREVRIEVPVEVIKEIEKEVIIEIPKIQIVEKPIIVTKEIYNIEKLIKEQNAHKQTQKKLYITTVGLAASILLNIIISAL